MLKWPLIGACLAALLAAGCGGGSSSPSSSLPTTTPTPTPTSTPSFQITAPAAGATNASVDLPVSIQVANFQLVNSSGPNQASQGHVNYWLDTDPTGNPNTPGAQQSFQPAFTISGVATAGNHTLFIELRNNDGTPLNPRVIRQVTFTTPTIHFSQDVLRVFTNNGAKTCAQAGCHSGANAQQGQNLEAANAYANIVNVPSTEKPSVLRVKPGDGDNSYLYQKITGASGIVGSQMPLAGGALAPADVDKIELWIDQGAPNN